MLAHWRTSFCSKNFRCLPKSHIFTSNLKTYVYVFDKRFPRVKFFLLLDQKTVVRLKHVPLKTHSCTDTYWFFTKKYEFPLHTLVKTTNILYIWPQYLSLSLKINFIYFACFILARNNYINHSFFNKTAYLNLFFIVWDNWNG